MKSPLTIGALLALTATLALAHDGVKNPAVQARMHAMSMIGNATKTLGGMARGKVEFDAAQAQAAATAIATQAALVPGLFEAMEDDPKSEARASIWDNFADFTAKSNALKVAAEGAQGVSSLAELRTAMGAIGGSCQACHKAYRE